MFSCIALAAVALIAVFFTYLNFGSLPVAVGDSPFPFEKQIVKTAIRARIGRQMQTAPIEASEDNLVAGAHIYQQRCSICHGTPGHDSVFAKHMFPPPPQLWKKHGPHGAVGVSDDETGFSDWIVTNGLRLTGMPSFKTVLSDRERWQVSLLLKNADKKQPASVTQTLNDQPPASTTAP